MDKQGSYEFTIKYILKICEYYERLGTENLMENHKIALKLRDFMHKYKQIEEQNDEQNEETNDKTELEKPSKNDTNTNENNKVMDLICICYLRNLHEIFKSFTQFFNLGYFDKLRFGINTRRRYASYHQNSMQKYDSRYVQRKIMRPNLALHNSQYVR